MSNYYDKREAKVNIAHELMARGWNVHGYRADESDSMTDYYSPAYWDGIAEKNGFVLVVDNDNTVESKEITRYNPKGNLSFDDREKISKLEKMTQKNGCTIGEEENAQSLITKIKEKTNDIPAYEVVGMSLAHMGNPKGSIWHIEKDGKLYDKGSALTKFRNIPNSYQFDLATMEYKKGHDYWGSYGNEPRQKKTITEEERKIINEFKTLLLRFERVAMGINSCGDGTTETEKAGIEQQQKEGYEKIIKNIVKKVTKPIQKTDNNINVNDVLSFSYHGHYWVVTDIYTNRKNEKCVSYELLGSEKRGYKRLSGTSLMGKKYYQTITRLEKEITEGKTKIYTLQEVEEITPTEKWEKITKKAYNTTQKTEPKKEVKKEEPKTEPKQPTQTQETKATEQSKPTITINPESGNIELTFTESINLDMKNLLRLNGYRFNSITKIWEVKNTQKSIEKLKTLFNYEPITEPTQEQPTETKKVYPADIVFNQKLNGIEIKFSGEIDEQTKATLKKNGFRFAEYKKLWYAVNTEKNKLFAQSITEPMQEKREAV